MSASEHPLVSVVTPSFNQAQYLETAIQSVLGQDYPNLEYLVIDGGSTDGSIEILERYAEHLTFWASEPDSGQAEAINKGLRMAKGDIVCWLNSDDAYMPGAVSEAVQTALQHPEAGMVYADGLMVDSELRLLDPHRYRPLTSLDLLSFEVLLQPTVFIRREALEEVGLLNETYDLILDHELWLRISGKFQLIHVPQFWALERTHPQAKTIQQAAHFVSEAQRLVDWAASSAEFGSLVEGKRSRIQAGLNVFSARRLIDAGQHSDALKHMLKALTLHPPTFLHYWYKFVQASLSALGLERMFFWYRDTRRKLRFGYRTISLPHLEGYESGAQSTYPSREPGHK